MLSPKLFLPLLLLSPLAQADEAYLDRPYGKLVHPKVNPFHNADSTVRTKNDVLAVIRQQTAVKSQAARGSCSMFSSVALLENALVHDGHADTSIDLSEEWLQYLIAQTATNDGSNSYSNFIAIRSHGVASEAKLPYIGATWKDLTAGGGLATARCGHVASNKLGNCLTGHRDPALLFASDESLANAASGALFDMEFLEARRDANQMRDRYVAKDNANSRYGFVSNVDEAKRLLDAGIAITLDVSFYYESWNHNGGKDLGLNVDSENWAKGIVGYPEPGTLDAAKSPQKPAGHSVVVVGYDDNREISYTAKMPDGTLKTFTRKGVYYFKNSWGTSGFGVRTEIEGQVFPGYGMISQDYAHQKGQFFFFEL